ncbi:MAG TPA: hypothetical protein VN193_02170 [Candidatus Angelobacter sp.]|jgi:hypothetical protein|nr:hypothetical protein [Candidatus Angelobacter sp.]
MSRRTRTQRQRAASPRAQRAVTTPPRQERSAADRMQVYRELASPGLISRLVLMVGLVLLSLAQGLSPRSGAPAALAVSGVVGGLCVLGFVGAGMLRHYRALYRIRREDPGAWQPTMSFALASLAVPLGFSGPAASPRDRLLRRLTLLLVLAYAVTTIIALNKQH